jgi:hypothetical protein
MLSITLICPHCKKDIKVKISATGLGLYVEEVKK